MMISYWKTQWWRIVLALISLVAALFYMFQPAADSSTIEGLNATMGDIINAGVYFAGFIIWTFLSVIEYNNDRIELLEKKAEKYDALCKEVHELYEANKIDREYQKMLEQKIRIPEEELR